MLTVGQDLDPTGGNRSSEASVLFDNMVLWPVMTALLHAQYSSY